MDACAIRALEEQETTTRRAAVRALMDAGVPFVLGGAYAMRAYTGLDRDTKDIDICCRPEELEDALACLRGSGLRIERTDPRWLAKAFAPHGGYVDLIFGSGNGVCPIDSLWLVRAKRAFVLGLEVPIAAPEELICVKSFVQERDRFDGADIHHLLRCTADRLDWDFLLWRMGEHGEVLLAHLVLFRYAFPDERGKVPEWAFARLVSAAEGAAATPRWRRTCRGTLLSRSQYNRDVQNGLVDARTLFGLPEGEGRLGGMPDAREAP